MKCDSFQTETNMNKTQQIK